MYKLAKNFFAVVGAFFIFLIAFYTFNNELPIKWDLGKQFAVKALGIGDDYTGFVADSFDEYLDIFIDGLGAKVTGNDYAKIDLILPFESMAKIDHHREESIKLNKYEPLIGDSWVKASIKYEDIETTKKLYKVKVKTKGDRKLHKIDFGNMSFKVKMKGRGRIFSMKKFSIQKPILRNYGWEYLITLMGNRLGILTTKIVPINFYVNGVRRGVYFLEESFSKELLENRNTKDGPTFSLAEEFGRTFPDVIFEPYGYSKISAKQRSQYAIATKKLLEIRKKYKDQNFRHNLYFDSISWAKFFALIDFFGAYHGALPKSVKFYFNASTQLFEPILYDAHVGGKNYANFSLIDLFQMDAPSYEKCGFVCSNSEFLNIFFKDKGFLSSYLAEVHNLLSLYRSDYFSDDFKATSKFNSQMYSSFEPSDRGFLSGLLPYHMDVSVLEKRARRIEAKANELSLALDFYSNEKMGETLFDKMYADNVQCNVDLLPSTCANKRVVRYHDLSLIDDQLTLPDNGILILSGNTRIVNSKVIGLNSHALILQVGGKFSAEESTFANIGDVNIEGSNLTGALNLIKSDVTLRDVTFENILGEDALNTVKSTVEIVRNLTFRNVAQDAFDSDFSDLKFEKIICENVGNDCLDTSGSQFDGGILNGFSVGDKLVSLGERSNGKIKNVVGSDIGIGIAVKDSSNAAIDNVSFVKTPLHFTVFKKKPFFSISSLNIENFVSDSTPSSLISRSQKVTLMGNDLKSNLTDKKVRKMLYGNEYGKASAR